MSVAGYFSNINRLCLLFVFKSLSRYTLFETLSLFCSGTLAEHNSSILTHNW